MKVVIGFALFLLLLQVSAAKKQPTYEELLLKVKSLEEKTDTTSAIVDSIKAGLNAKISSVNSTCAGSRQTAYFFVERSSDMWVNALQRVLFNNIRYIFPSNKNYYTNTGIYGCPYDGTYLFFFTLTGYYWHSSYQYYRFAIMSNGQYLAYTQSRLHSDNRYETISAMTIAPCKKGQGVYVQEAYGYKQYVYHSSHFTGVKIA